MCGIIGYAGARQAAPIILEGLAALEYRGYDSAGIAVLDADGIPAVHKKSGKLVNLAAALQGSLPEGVTGVGHTRWATHGPPTDFNAHPHTDCDNQIIVVHNGIVENYVQIKEDLISQGHEFTSQTDAECIPHMIESYIDQEYSFEEAVRASAREIKGANAVVAISTLDPGKLVAFRLGNAGGLVVGYGQDELFLASDLPALLPHTQEIAYLAGGEMVTLDDHSANYFTLDGMGVTKSPMHVAYDALSAAKGEYKHFMLKEIMEQPQAVASALRGRVNFETRRVELPGFPITAQEIVELDRVILIGCGTSLNAAQVGRHLVERYCGLPAEAESASEFRYRDPYIGPRTLVVSIGQSGETADTVAAMQMVKDKGGKQSKLRMIPT